MIKVKFRKKTLAAAFHDPRNDFRLTMRFCEIRYDPLTRQLSRIFPSKMLKFSRYDWAPEVMESRSHPCPFCPENLEAATPRFPEDFVPGGRIMAGRAVVVPNLSIYESYNGVVIMGPDHYLPMGEITFDTLVQSLAASLEFLRTAARRDPAHARYGTVDWNYMPLAGGSVIHPHLQVIAGKDPSSHVGLMVREGRKYLRARGRIFWADLLEAEAGGPRYLGRTRGVYWLASFAPRGLADVTAVIPERAAPEDIGEEDIRGIASGMIKVIGYYDSVNIPAFNAAIYFARREDEGFWASLRMIGRFAARPPAGSDVSYMQTLLGDPWTFHLPEEMAVELKKHF